MENKNELTDISEVKREGAQLLLAALCNKPNTFGLYKLDEKPDTSGHFHIETPAGTIRVISFFPGSRAITIRANFLRDSGARNYASAQAAANYLHSRVRDAARREVEREKEEKARRERAIAFKAFRTNVALGIQQQLDSVDRPWPTKVWDSYADETELVLDLPDPNQEEHGWENEPSIKIVNDDDSNEPRVTITVSIGRYGHRWFGFRVADGVEAASAFRRCIEVCKDATDIRKQFAVKEDK